VVEQIPVGEELPRVVEELFNLVDERLGLEVVEVLVVLLGVEY
jgi:hypothetical protein